MAKQQNMRVSQGYQKNQMKKIMADLDIPDIDAKKIKRIGIAIAVGAVVLMIGLTYAFKIWGALAALAITVLVGGYYIKKLTDQQKKIISAYKALGFTREEYVSSFEKVEMSKGRRKAMIDLWDKVPEPEKVVAQKGKPQKVGQSKQNKKKKTYKKKKKK